MLYRGEKAQREHLTAPHGNLTADPANAAAAADAVEAWMFKMGVPEKPADMGYIDADVEKLVRLTRETLRSAACSTWRLSRRRPKWSARSTATRSSPVSEETLRKTA